MGSGTDDSGTDAHWREQEGKKALERLAQIASAPASPRSVEEQNWMIKRKITTTLWLIGASYAQLSMLFGVTRPTIRQQVLKEISQTSKRLYQSASYKDRMSFDVISWYHSRLNERLDKVAAMTADQLAIWLTTEHPYQGD